MKRFILSACAGLVAATMAVPSFAADLPRKAAPAPYYVAPFSWSGFYVGINGGYGWGRVTSPFGGLDVTGALAGGTIGYNMQTGVWVWGLEGDFDYSWIKGSDPSGEFRNKWFGTARGRIGYSFDRWLAYFTGGAAFADEKITTVLGSESKTKIGWTVGAGLEYAFMGNWSAKIEYLYADLGKWTCGAATCAVPTDLNFKLNIARAGINYRF